MESHDIDWQRASGLNRVNMEGDLTSPTDPPNLFNRLDGANLVIGVHDRGERGLIGDSLFQFTRVNASILVNRQVGHSKAETLQVLAGVEDGMMLDRRGDDVLALLLGSEGHALDRQIIALGTAADKGNFRWPRMNRFRYLFARTINGLHGIATKRIDAAGIAIFGGQIGHHSIQHAPVKRGGCGMIEIDSALWHTFLFSL